MGFYFAVLITAVFRLAGSAAILCCAVTCLPDSIWKGQKWSVSLNNLLDGVVYGIVTAAVLGRLRPEGP